MSAWAVVEPLLLTLVLLACAAYAVRRLAPAACRRARGACALALLRRDRAWLRQLGRRLAPAPALARAGMASRPGCGPCGGCDKAGS